MLFACRSAGHGAWTHRIDVSKYFFDYVLHALYYLSSILGYFAENHFKQ